MASEAQTSTTSSTSTTRTGSPSPSSDHSSFGLRSRLFVIPALAAARVELANAVIKNNREGKPKELWSELGDGEPVRVVEVEDEHAEARFVAAGIAGLVEEGFSGDEVAIFYRTNAQSRVLEDVLVRQGVGYQVIGGPRFYERAEIKDAIAYLQVIDNPYDTVSLTRIANKPRRGVGDTSLARLATFAAGEGISLWEALGRAE